MNTKKFSSESSVEYLCENCDYVTSRKSQYGRHILTAKHKILTNPNKKVPCKIYSCECGKIYKHQSSLCFHKKICVIQVQVQVQVHLQNESSLQNIILDASSNQIEHLTSLVIDVVKQNQELQKQMLEMASKSNIINYNNSNNNSNNSFNLNFFLNETCKDAMNLTDFVNSLTISLTDLENTGKLGYEEGISQIFINGLKELAIDKRPIHCTDLKREKLYIKNENIWGKDSEQENIKQTIRKVANKNVNQITDWVNANPESQSFINPKNYNSKKNDEYLNIVLKATGGSTKEEEEKKICKVVSNIAKHVEIDKSVL